jgi:hypothetical protein
MGMYTEFVLSCQIMEQHTDAVNVIKMMVGDAGNVHWERPNHAFFSCDRWMQLFHSSSHYFTPRSVCLFEYDDISKTWCLIVNSSLKNYSNEIEEFIDWLSPYLYNELDDMIGYSRYEEDHEPKILRRTR